MKKEKNIENKVKYKLIIGFGSEVQTWDEIKWEGKKISDPKLKEVYDQWNEEKWRLIREPIIENNDVLDKTEYIVKVEVHRGFIDDLKGMYKWKKVNYENYLRRNEIASY
jgi:hypothetical protein